MTIGPAIVIGGNKVEMKTNGKVQVTNEEGKVKTMSQDQFKKQLVKNADKLNNGENIEFKNDNKTGLIVGGAAATAVIATGIIFRKDISKYMKDFSWKKLGQDIKGLFGKAKDKTSHIINNRKIQAKRQATYSIDNATRDAHLAHANDFNASLEKGSSSRNQRAQMIKDARAAFTNYMPPEV